MILSMTHLWRSFIWRKLWREPFRAAATLVGIALGISVIVAIELAKTSSVDGFRESIEQMSGRAALEISAPGGLPEAQLSGLRWLREFGLPCPVVEGDAAVAGEETAERLHVLGVDILRDQEVRDYELVEFAQGRRQPTPTEFLSLLRDPDKVILTEKFARRRGWKVGDEVKLVFGDQALTMRIAALLLDRGVARAMEGNLALMDIAAAQAALNKPGRIDRLELRLRRESDLEPVQQAVAPRLPPGWNLGRPARRGEEVEKMLTAYHFNLTLLSGIAFLAGLYVIYNSVALSVIGRRPEIGMLRTVGTARRTVVGMFLGEALTLAVPGCLLGLWLGEWLARGAMTLTQTTMQTLYSQQGIATAQPLPGKMGVTVFGAGLVLSLLAALRPALEAARVSPVEAVRNIPDVAATAPGAWRGPVLMAVLLFTATVVLCLLPAWGGKPLGGGMACLTGIAAMACLVPWVLNFFLRWNRALLTSGRGAAGLLAWASLAGGVRRISLPVSALGGTLALSTAIAIMVGSFRQTLIYWVENSLAADLYVRAGTKRGVGMDAPLSPDTLKVLTSHPAVEASDMLRSFDIPYQGGRIVLAAADFGVMAQRGKLAFQNLPEWREVLRSCRGQDSVTVSESFSLRYQVHIGEMVSLPTQRGAAAFRIAGIYYDYSNDRGTVTMDHTTYERHFGPLQATNAAIFLRPGSDPEQVREELLLRLGSSKRLTIFTNASLRAEVLRIFDRTFSITWALEAIAIMVAMAGVATTVFTLVLERQEELRLLRQLGAARGQLRRTVAVESGFLGLAGQLLGLVSGFGLSFILIYVINVQSFGWTLQFHPPWILLAEFTVTLPAATALAGWLFSAGILRVAGQRSHAATPRE